jgi:hypothetical protein
MPAFCRHNRLLQNCPICTREQGTEMNPVVSSSTPKVSEPRERSSTSSTRPAAPRAPRSPGAARSASPRSGSRAAGGLRVRKLERGVEDGYRSGLLQGVRSSADATHLAEEIAVAATRLIVLETDPPEPLAHIARGSADLEERTWQAVQFELGRDPESWVDWSSGESAEAYRAWAARSGSQQAAFSGEPRWTPQRRFERIFERLGTLGLLERHARFDLLVVLGRLGLYALESDKLFPGGENETTWGAKRAFGIGDPLLIERRAADLATACRVPIAALDLALFNWNVGRSRRSDRGVAAASQPDPDLRAAVHGALEL